MLCHSQKPYHSISIRHMTLNIWGGKKGREFCSIEPRAAVFVLSSYCVWRPRGTKKICPLHRYKQGTFFIAFCSSNNIPCLGGGAAPNFCIVLYICIIYLKVLPAFDPTITYPIDLKTQNLHYHTYTTTSLIGRRCVVLY